MPLQTGDKIVMQKTRTRRWTFLYYREGVCQGNMDRGLYSRQEAERKINDLLQAGYQVDTSEFFDSPEEKNHTHNLTVPFPLSIKVAAEDGRVMSVRLPNTDDVEAAQKLTLYAVLEQRASLPSNVYGPFFSESDANAKAAELRTRFPKCNISVKPLLKNCS